MIGCVPVKPSKTRRNFYKLYSKKRVIINYLEIESSVPAGACLKKQKKGAQNVRRDILSTNEVHVDVHVDVLVNLS